MIGEPLGNHSAYCDLGGTCDECCDNRPWVCMSGQMCQLPTPDCPDLKCRTPSGYEECPECGAYDVGDWAVSYVSSGTSTWDANTAAWSPSSAHSFTSPPFAQAFWSFSTRGEVKIRIQFVGGDPTPECVHVRIYSYATSFKPTSAFVYPNDGHAQNGLGDPTIVQYILGFPGVPRMYTCEGTHDFGLPVDPTTKTAEFSVSPSASGSNQVNNGYCQVIVNAAVLEP